MHPRVEIENIEEIRRREGIDDVELRKDIRRLAVGDCVKLSLLTGATTFETVVVRITSIRGTAFRGKLAKQPVAKGLAQLRAGSSLSFTADHIHSIPCPPKVRTSHEQ